jgi:SNF2 family DNA or RNA helicase
VHRLGQKKQVYVKRFIAVDTIEESMLEIQERKQQLAHNALSASASNAQQKLTEEEIRGFFRR